MGWEVNFFSRRGVGVRNLHILLSPTSKTYKHVTNLQLTDNYDLFYVDPFQPQTRNTRKLTFLIL